MVRLLERQATPSYATSPSPWAWMVPLTPHHHPNSRLLTGIPDPGARTNPDSRDISTITMLEVDLFPVYLGEKAKKTVSPSPARTRAEAVTGPSRRRQMMAALL